MFCDGPTGRKYRASRFHSCAAFLGCGISFCGGFVNSAKLFSENNQTKTRAHERMPPRRRLRGANTSALPRNTDLDTTRPEPPLSCAQTKWVFMRDGLASCGRSA